MEAMRESWTDARLDDFREETARRFDRVESDIREISSEIREMRSEMSEGFKEMNSALRSMQRTMVYGVISLSAAIVTGFGAMAGLLGA